MNTTAGFLKRHSLACGVALMFALTWPIDLANSGVLPFEVPFAIYIVLGWGFVVAALTMTGLTLGTSGVTALLKRFLIWRVGWRWYFAAFLLFPAIFAAAVGLNALLTQAPADFGAVMAHKIFGAAADLPLLVLPYFLFDAITNGEEMGWRGYVLPRLQGRHSALAASLILGVMWGVWHWPKFLAPGASATAGWFMIKIMADGILYTWLYNGTGGSLLLTTILHAAGNTAGAFLPMANTVSGENMSVLVFAIAMEIGAAVLVTIYAGPENLSRRAAKQVQPWGERAR